MVAVALEPIRRNCPGCSYDRQVTFALVPQLLRELPGRYVVEPADEAVGEVARIEISDDRTVVRQVAADAADGWVALSSEGTPHGLEEPGMTVSLLLPLAEAGIGVFVASTLSADVVLVAGPDVSAARRALVEAGHRFVD